ncbi:MAG: hypothetical protein HOC23_18645 [Halieaceae bacterium]|nr:hypothetical protein [Halieaceae bacterium]
MKTQWHDVFESIAASEASHRYCIGFTARSGSTWLGSLIQKSDILGIPLEWFNPDAAGKTVRGSACRDLAQYYQYLKIARTSGDVFGMELTWPQARMVFNSGYPNLFDDIQHWFYLRRRDYVAQGVSLYKAASSGHFHSVQANNKKQKVNYDGKAIAASTLRIMATEFGFDSFYSDRGFRTEELWYEDIISTTPEAILMRFIDVLQLPISAYRHVDFGALSSRFEKVGDSQNELMMSQFRREHPEFVAYWDQYRGKRSVDNFVKEYPQYKRQAAVNIP